jgi:hypothetical protein
MAKNEEEIKNARTFLKFNFFELTPLILKRRYFFADCAFFINPEKLSSKRKKQKMREPE